MRWLGGLIGLLLLVAVVGRVGEMTYQAGLAHAPLVGQTVQTGTEGGTVIVQGGYYSAGHPFGFFHFFLGLLFFGFLFKMLASGFWRGGGGHRGGHGGWEDHLRQRHDEWHAGGGSSGGTSTSEPPSAAAGL